MGNWNKDHIEFWKDDLIIKDNGFSSFQSTLFSQTKEILDSISISFQEIITKYIDDLNEEDKEVKLITLKLDNGSEVWIYNDMAEYDISGLHHIYEEWGYLKPKDLQLNFLNSIKEILKLKKQSN
jgi:hypothetical protein